MATTAATTSASTQARRWPRWLSAGVLLMVLGTGVAIGNNGDTDSVYPGSFSPKETVHLVPPPGGTLPEAYELGQTATYADGTTVTVGPGTPVTLSKDAYGGEDFDTHLRFQVTLVNGAAKSYDPTRKLADVTSGGIRGDQAYDGSRQDPRTKVLPGKKAIWFVTFGVEDPGDITVEIEPDFERYDEVTFVSAAPNSAPDPAPSG